MFGHGELMSLYRTNFVIKHNFKNFSIDELEEMLPYEREIYLMLLHEQIEKEKNALKNKGK